jgi:hypothetical protein
MIMNAITVDKVPLSDSRLIQFFKTANEGSRTLTLHAAAMLVCFGLCTAMQFVDPRELNGANVWIKPGKFFISMTIHFLTVAWAMSLLQPAQRASRVMAWLVRVLLVTAWAELLYIAFRASQATASHYNLGTPLSSALYSIMAVFAVLLVVVPGYIGFKIWRENPKNLWAEAIAIGFGLGAVLSVIVGMTLGGNSSHWIGGDLTDATGLPIFKWSTTGGDLRVSHFLSLHAMQIVPFAALSEKRSVVWGAAFVVTVLTVLTYVQALSGVPLLRAI